MSRMRWAPLIVAGLALPAPALAQAAPIGEVRQVLVWAYGTPTAQARRDLFARARVMAEETVETVTDGALHLRFADDTEFRLGPASRAVLDRYVYDPQRGTGAMAVSLSVGTFRLISGRMNKDCYRLTTPTAVIGVRGTDVLIRVAADGSTSVGVREGMAIVNGAEVREREQAIVGADRAAVVGSQPPLGNTVDSFGLTDRLPATAASGGGQR